MATSQLATKMINSDGSPGTFDTGALGVMVPQLGSVPLTVQMNAWTNDCNDHRFCISPIWEVLESDILPRQSDLRVSAGSIEIPNSFSYSLIHAPIRQLRQVTLVSSISSRLRRSRGGLYNLPVCPRGCIICDREHQDLSRWQVPRSR
jgi:hypothetical protein